MSYVFAKALEEVALVIKWPPKYPLKYLLPGLLLHDLFRFGISLLSLGHSWTCKLILLLLGLRIA